MTFCHRFVDVWSDLLERRDRRWKLIGGGSFTQYFHRSTFEASFYKAKRMGETKTTINFSKELQHKSNQLQILSL